MVHLIRWGRILYALGMVVKGHWFMATGDDCCWQGYKNIRLINNDSLGFFVAYMLHFLHPSELEADKPSWFSDHDLYRWKTCFTIEPRSQSFFVCLFLHCIKVIFSFPFSVLKPSFLCLYPAERMLFQTTTSVFMTIVKKNLQFFPWKLKCCLVTAWKITSLKDRSFSNRLPGIIIEIILQYK